MSNVISVRDLRYRYPRASTYAVDGMTFDVAEGEVFGFLGPSGAGKTTTQQIVIGLLEGWSGSVEILGRPRRDWRRDLYDHIGVSFELPVGYPRLSVREDLAYFGNLHRTEVLDPIEVLRAVGLADAADVRISDLSKGMRVRLNLARSLLHQPRVLFLDEPTSGLDPVNTSAIRDIIRRLRESGKTVFLTTHDMATAAAVCDRVAFVVEGRIATIGNPRELELAHGRRVISVEYREDDRVVSRSFPVGTSDPAYLALLTSDSLVSVHTEDATLDEVFVELTGARL